jgi:tRNA(Ile)-lysidine synthase
VCLAAHLQIDYYEGITIGLVKTEGRARLWRYDVMQTVAISNNYTSIVTGHSASDRIETLLYNFTRGSGLHGLQSIRWKRSFCSSLLSHSYLSNNHLSFYFKPLKYKKSSHQFTIFTKIKFYLTRPLLETTRTEIRGLVKFLNFPVWLDKTNKEIRISRNRIRHRLVPYLRIHYNLNIDQTLARLAEIVQAETFYLEQVTNFLLSKVQIIKKSYSVTQKIRKKNLKQTFYFYQSAIAIDLLRSLPTAIQRRVLKQHIYNITGRSLGFQSIEQIRFYCLFRNFFSKINSSSNHSQDCQEALAMEHKNKKNSWVLLPNGINLLIKNNYLFLFSAPFSRV